MSDGPVFNLGEDFHLGPRVEVRQFQCARCGDICTSTTTEAEANREFLTSGQGVGTGISSVCDECYEYVMAKAREDGLL